MLIDRTSINRKFSSTNFTQVWLGDGIMNFTVGGYIQATADSTGFHPNNGATADLRIPSGDGYAAYTIHFVSGIYVGKT